ncbi:MAG: SCO family protein [Alphaproteobacteria bacterium]|nr:SCO family protein [Alphaproteobacteria bacterium]
MPGKRTNSLILILAGALVIGAAILITWAVLRADRPAAVSGIVESVGVAQIGGPFALVDHTGKARTEADFRGKYMLVFFGFTHCPDVCPTGLATVAQALEEVGPLADRIVPAFVSVDPERDTPELLGGYVTAFSPRFVGLTGTPEQVAQAAKAYRVIYKKIDVRAPDAYNMMHSALFYLMGPDGKFVTHFGSGTSASQMATGLKKHVAG